jgi:hypothetical protein
MVCMSEAQMPDRATVMASDRVEDILWEVIRHEFC